MYGIRHLQNAFKQFPSSYHPPIYLIYLIDDDKKRGEKNVEKYLDLVNQQRKKVEFLKKLIKDIVKLIKDIVILFVLLVKGIRCM